MTTVDGPGYVCEAKNADGSICNQEAIHLHDQDRGGKVAKFICLKHLVYAIDNGSVRLFLPHEIAAAEAKVEGVLDKVNDIERLCATCGAEVDGVPAAEEPAFEVSW